MSDFLFTFRATPRKFNSPRLAVIIKGFGELPSMLDRLGKTLTKTIKRNLSGRILQKRTGKLHDSWAWLIEPMNNGWRLVVGSDVIYARIQDLGGWTGRGHATKIPKSRYVDRAVIEKKAAVRKITENWFTKIVKG
jgi:phage gpG-like protein